MNQQRERAKALRKNMTEAESILWYRLRAHRLQGFKFKRQKPIGPFIVDFTCVEYKLVVEVDGGQHQEKADYDRKRDAWLRREGFQVLRFWNHEVMQNLDGVLEVIHNALVSRSLSPNPSPVRGRGEQVAGNAEPQQPMTSQRQSELSEQSSPKSTSTRTR